MIFYLNDVFIDESVVIYLTITVLLCLFVHLSLVIFVLYIGVHKYLQMIDPHVDPISFCNAFLSSYCSLYYKLFCLTSGIANSAFCFHLRETIFHSFTFSLHVFTVSGFLYASYS